MGFPTGYGDLPGFPSGSTTTDTGGYNYKPYVPGSRDFGFEVPAAFNNGEPYRDFGNGIKQVDVRTRNMRALEEAALPILMQALLSPQSLTSSFSKLAGPVSGLQPGSLSNFLFNDAGAFTGQAGGGQSGSGGGTGGTGGGTGNVDPHGDPPPPLAVPRGGSAQPPYGTDLGSIGGLLGGGTVDPNSPNANNKLLDPAAILAQFGINAPGDYGGFQGLLPGSAMPGGQDLNLGYLNQFLNPQGYAAGSPHPQGTDLGTQGLLNLFGPSGTNKNFGKGPAAVSGLQQFLTQLGVKFSAHGGPLNPGDITVVGEQGPEVIIGNQVLPLKDPHNMATLLLHAGAKGMANGGLLEEQPIQINGPGTWANMQQPPGHDTVTTTGTGQFPTSPTQGAGTGSIQRLLEQNPEMQTFNQANSLLGGSGGILGSGGGGEGILKALQPRFQQNLQFGLNSLTNAVPSVRNSAAAIQGADLTSRALNDYNVLAAQALQQGQSNTLGGLGLLGQLAGQAGSGQFNRNLQAGQLATQRDLGMGSLGLQAQQQQWNQTVNPTLQLLLAALGMAQPTAFQTVVGEQK